MHPKHRYTEHTDAAIDERVRPHRRPKQTTTARAASAVVAVASPVAASAVWVEAAAAVACADLAALAVVGAGAVVVAAVVAVLAVAVAAFVGPQAAAAALQIEPMLQRHPEFVVMIRKTSVTVETRLVSTCDVSARYLS